MSPLCASCWASRRQLSRDTNHYEVRGQEVLRVELEEKTPLGTQVGRQIAYFDKFSRFCSRQRMNVATSGLKGNAFNDAYDAALTEIARLTKMKGSRLNRLATGG